LLAGAFPALHCAVFGGEVQNCFAVLAPGVHIDFVFQRLFDECWDIRSHSDMKAGPTELSPDFVEFIRR